VMREIHQAGKPIACVCHGIEILTAAGIIQGRTVTTVPKCKMDAEQGGATYVDKEVVLDGHFITSRYWMDNAHLLREFLKMLRSPK
jgi:protease I